MRKFQSTKCNRSTKDNRNCLIHVRHNWFVWKTNLFTEPSSRHFRTCTEEKFCIKISNVNIPELHSNEGTLRKVLRPGYNVLFKITVFNKDRETDISVYESVI
jgi:hypothetical protein